VATGGSSDPGGARTGRVTSRALLDFFHSGAPASEHLLSCYLRWVARPSRLDHRGVAGI
jgi:hypothetical protein